MTITALIEGLNRSVLSDPWYGSSLRDVLADVSAAEAEAHPLVNAHSIIEIVLHIGAWIEEVDSRLRGEPASLPDSGDWPDGYTWPAAKAKLEVAHSSLLRSLKRFREDRLQELVGIDRDPSLGTGISFEAMLIGLAQHHAYHCGQIVLLKRMLRKPKVLLHIN
jgi:uncharacterized damage-inducible protein DinB